MKNQYIPDASDVETIKELVKFWGTNRCIYSEKNFEVHHAQIVEGGFSSKHHHVYKVNNFYIVSGTLKVFLFDDTGKEVHCVTLGTGTNFSVPPGVEHKFEAITNVDLIEIYWANLDPDDIVRVDIGGVKSNTNA
jgi:mannose-6-phosphate isomerase-like protein (cupin superfamily)